MRFSFASFCRALLFGGLLVSSTASAATFTWDGGGADGNWGTAANWNPDGAPTATGNNFIFAGTTNLNAVNNIVTSTDTTTNSTAFTFSAGAGAFVLSGNALTVGTTAGNSSLANNQSTSAITIQNNLTLAGNGRDVNLGFGSGAGSVTLSGNVNFNSCIIGLGFTSTTTSAGTLILTGTNTGLGKGNQVTGGGNSMRAINWTNVDNNRIIVGSDSALGAVATGSVTSGNGVLNGILTSKILLLSTTGGNRNLSGNSIGITGGRLDFDGANNLSIGHVINSGGNRDLWVTGTGKLTITSGLFLSNDGTGRNLYFNVTGAGGAEVSGTVYDTFSNTSGVFATIATPGQLRKAGSGVLRLSGANPYAATTSIEAGTLLVNGTHAPTQNSGRYSLVSSATLGGTGIIRPFDTTASLTGLTLSGTTAPGDSAVNSGIGTLTLDGVNSARSLVAFETGGTLAMQLGAYGAADRIAIVNGQTNDVFFNNNVINFTDTSSGSLAGGEYVLFSANVANAYSGLTVDGSGNITAGLSIGTGLTAYPGSTLKRVGNNIVLNLIAPAPSAPTGLTVTGTSGGTSLSWTPGANSGAFTVMRSTTSGGPYTTVISGLTTTTYVDRVFTPGTTYYYVVFSSSTAGTSANSNEASGAPTTLNGTWNGGTGNYTDTSKWSGGVIASGTGATMTVTSAGTITVNTTATIGNITAASSGTSLVLQGSAGNGLYLTTATGTPTFDFTTWFTRYDYLTNINIAGTQGLAYKGKSNALVLQSGVTWTGFSGGFTLTPSGDASQVYAQAANVLPNVDITMTPVTAGGTLNTYGNAKIVLNSGANQTIGALNSTASTSGSVTQTAYLSSYTGGTNLTGSAPAGTNTSGFATLTVGSTNTDGSFAGKLGVAFNNSTGVEDTTANLLNLTKTGTATQRFTGTLAHTGTTTVSGGALLINGTYDQGTGANAGRILVSSGATLGGSGSVKLSDTNGGTTGISVSGTLAPGDTSAGTFTLNGSTSTRSVLSMESGASLLIRLNSALTCTKVALTSGQANDVFFNNNVVNFSDASSGALSSGQYVIFTSDVAGAFSGLTTDGSGFITAGLTIGSGLSSFTNTSLQVVGNNIVLNLTNPNAPVPVALSFNVKGTSNTGMTPAEVAGASGARFANWNNLNVTSGSGSMTNLVDSNGAQVTGVSVSLSGGNGSSTFSRGLASPSNDTRVFDTVYDKFDGTATTVTVTGIPYGAYDVYFYMADDGAARGGSFTVGGSTYYLRGGAGTPTSSGTGYVQSTDTTFNSGADTQANYVKFTGLTGTLTATFTAVNQGDSVQRLKFPGFQIVGTAAPANTAPGTPSGVTITANSSTSYTIAWSAVNGATSYQIFRSTTSGSFNFGSPLATVAAPTLSYTDATAVAGTTYFYVVRAVNGVGSSTSSSEVTNPPPDLSSVVASSPVIWPGGSSTLSWALPNADSLTIDSGSGPQSYATTGSLVVTPSVTTNYVFSAINGQGTTNKTVSVTLTPKPNTKDDLWQWSVPVNSVVTTNVRAYLYIPPNVTTVRGVLIGQNNMLEKPILEHTSVRQGLADAGMAAIFVTDRIDPFFNFTANPNTPVYFQQMLDALATESGYAELSKTPVILIGHSAMASSPYHYVAWDKQTSTANGTPRRAAAAISIKGQYPNYRDANTPTFADSDLTGVPLMFINGEYENAMGRATSSLNFKNNTPGAIMSMFVDNGRGHFDWSDRVCDYIGMYLRKIGQYRLPATAAADGTAVLQTIDTSTQGWLDDRWRKGQNPTAEAAAVGSYSGNVSEAFWFFDQEHAQTTHNAYLPVKTAYQLVGFTQNGSDVVGNFTHFSVYPSWSPDPTGDGLTFKLGCRFLDVVPAVGGADQAPGTPIGHASGGGPVLIDPIVGAVEQLSPDTFAIRFNRMGSSYNSSSFQAWHPGDSTYNSAVQQSLLTFPATNTSGAAQAITFPQPADQLVGATTIPLTATTTGTATYAGATVYYYVREGAAKVNGSTLEFTTLPPRTKFPSRVTVVATQWGRSIAPLLQTATPVTRTLWIYENALQQWRYQTFGTLGTASNGEPQWTLEANSGDTQDYDGDGLTNQQEFAAATDPKVAQTALEVWRVQNFGSAANTGSFADTGDNDGDGVSNLVEFAFGMNPAANSTGTFAISGSVLTQTGMPAANVETLPGTVNYTARFVRRKTHSSDGLIYTPQFSADLTTWQNSTATPTVVASDATHDVVEVTYPFFIGGKKARFFRIAVSTSP